MKLLMLSEENDIFYHILLEALNGLDVHIGHADFSISEEDMNSFDPDVIIHNGKEISKINYKNAITISINELEDDNCFSYKNPEAKNFIRPFVKPLSQDLTDGRYRSDVVYVGNPTLLPDCVSTLQADASVVFKMLNNTPVPVTQYCGSCTFNDYKKFFKMSKCSLVSKADTVGENLSFKILDILYSGGNPVLHTTDDQFLSDIKEAINGKSFRGNFISKEEIENDHTNYNRMSEIFQKVGLNKMSKMILASKDK